MVDPARPTACSTGTPSPGRGAPTTPRSWASLPPAGRRRTPTVEVGATGADSGGQGRGAVDGDHEQRRSDSHGHREAESQHEGRDEDESSSDTEEPGHQADRGDSSDDLGDPGAGAGERPQGEQGGAGRVQRTGGVTRVTAAGASGAAQHHRGDDEHPCGEGGQEGLRRYVGRQGGPGERAGGAECPEEQPLTEAGAAGAGVRDYGDERGRSRVWSCPSRSGRPVAPKSKVPPVNTPTTSTVSLRGPSPLWVSCATGPGWPMPSRT